ncbi:MAG: hypothetical protein IT438_14960 [Phycisphaerales bacterium]|nr:hypothetical protein [Phycisphaerales bacterium]
MNRPTADTLFAQASSRLSIIFARVGTLLERIDNLMSRVAGQPPAAPESWYWPAIDPAGRTTDPDRLAAMSAANASAIDRSSAMAINAVLELRKALDEAEAAVDAVSPLVTSNNGVTKQSWAQTTKDRIGAIRRAIVAGQEDRVPPSCLPIPHSETHNQIYHARHALDPHLYPLQLERDQFAKRAALAEPVFTNAAAAVIFSTTPHLWQRLQIILDLFRLERGESPDASLDRFGQLGDDGLTVVARNLIQRIPIGLRGDAESICIEQCNQLTTLFGSLRRVPDTGLPPESQTRLTSQATDLADWIEGVLRPYYPEQWVAVPALRLALKPKPMAVAEVYASLMELVDAEWRIECIGRGRDVPLDRLRRALSGLPDPPTDELASVVNRLESISQSGCVPGSRLGFPGIQDEQVRQDASALVAWWQHLITLPDDPEHDDNDEADQEQVARPSVAYPGLVRPVVVARAAEVLTNQSTIYWTFDGWPI